jgi:hypothetical protein
MHDPNSRDESIKSIERKLKYLKRYKQMGGYGVTDEEIKTLELEHLRLIRQSLVPLSKRSRVDSLDIESMDTSISSLNDSFEL